MAFFLPKNETGQALLPDGLEVRSGLFEYSFDIGQYLATSSSPRRSRSSCAAATARRSPSAASRRERHVDLLLKSDAAAVERQVLPSRTCQVARYRPQAALAHLLPITLVQPAMSRQAAVAVSVGAGPSIGAAACRRFVDHDSLAANTISVLASRMAGHLLPVSLDRHLGFPVRIAIRFLTKLADVVERQTAAAF